MFMLVVTDTYDEEDSGPLALNCARQLRRAETTDIRTCSACEDNEERKGATHCTSTELMMPNYVTRLE
jgi:hypothetical protein